MHSRLFPALAAWTRRAQRGSNAIEFALTLPVFVALAFGMIDYGYFLARNAVFDAAVSHGCREGAMIDENVGSPTATADAEMQTYMSGLGFACAGGCTTSATITGVVPTKTLACNVNATHSPLLGYVPLPNTLDSTTLMRLEWQR